MPLLVPIFTWLTSFLSGPALKIVQSWHQDSLAAGNTSERIAADLAARELDVARQETIVQSQLKVAEIGHPFEVEKLFAYVTLIFYAKVLLWDKCLGWGSTDALRGDVSDWAGYIMAFYFSKRAIENVARIIKRK